MNSEIANNIISTRENLESFFELHKSNLMMEVKGQLLHDFRRQLEEIAGKYDLSFDCSKKMGEKDTEWFFKTNKGYYLCFYFLQTFNGFVYGIRTETNQFQKDETEVLIRKLGDSLDRNKFKNWMWLNRFESDFADWSNNVSPWLGIKDLTLKENIESKIKTLMGALDAIQTT